MKTKLRLLAGIVSLLFVMQSVGPSVAIASDIEDSQETTIEFVNDPVETTTSETTEESVETTLNEENQPSETPTSEETSFSETITESETHSEEPSIESETSEPSEETTIEVIDGWTNITVADSQDSFINGITDLSNAYRLIFISDDNIDNIFAVKEGITYEGAYVVSFENQTDLDNAVQILAKSGVEYSLDGVVSVCSPTSIANQLSTIKRSNGFRVAVIDTGSNSADERYSVLDGDGTDPNGHGTQMCNIVKEAGCYVISIQAIGANGKGRIVDIYNAFQLAESLNVDYILMSFSARDLGSYDTFKSLVADSSHKVVVAAGNNNKDASLYVPANISNVIVVGALNEDLTKATDSNYGTTVDKWVVADSTSQAAALYIQYEMNKQLDSIYDSYVEDQPDVTPEPTPTTEPTPTVEPTPTIEPTPTPVDTEYPYEDGNYIIDRQEIDGEEIIVVTQINDFLTTSYNVRKISDFTISAELARSLPTGTFWEKGTGTMSNSSGGVGTLSGMTATAGTANRPFTTSQINSSIKVECAAHFGDSYVNGSTAAQNNANASSQANGAVNYITKYTISKSGNVVSIQASVWTSNRDVQGNTTNGYSFADPSWTDASDANVYRVYVNPQYLTSSGGQSLYNFNLVLQKYTDGSWVNKLTLGSVGSGVPAGQAPTSAEVAQKTNQCADQIKSYIEANGYSGKRFQGISFGTVAKESGTSNWIVPITVRYKTASGTQTYYNQGAKSTEIVLGGDMLNIQYSNKSNSGLNKSYTLRKYNETVVNGVSQPSTVNSGYTAKTVTANANGLASFTGSNYELGWYGVDVVGGRVYVYLFEMNYQCYKVIYYVPSVNGSISWNNKVVLHDGEPCPWNPQFTYQDVAIPTIGEAFPNNSSINNKHSVTLDGKTLTNDAFCIEPDQKYTKTPNGWQNYYSTSTSVPANLTTLATCIPNLRSGKITTTTQLINLCKILYSTQYTTQQKQQFMWYLIGVDGYTAETYNLFNNAIPTYTSEAINKGEIDFPYILRYGSTTGTEIIEHQFVNVGQGTTTAYVYATGTNSSNFTTTNFTVSVQNANGVTASIDNTNHRIKITIPSNMDANVLNQVVITVSSKSSYRMAQNGGTSSPKDYYAFSIGNTNSSEQRRFTGYYASKTEYYTTSFDLRLTNAKTINSVVVGDTYTFNVKSGSTTLKSIAAKHFCIEPSQNYVKPGTSGWTEVNKPTDDRLGELLVLPRGREVNAKDFCKILMATLPLNVSNANLSAPYDDVEVQKYIWKTQGFGGLGDFGGIYGDIGLYGTGDVLNVPEYNTTYIKKNYSACPYYFYIYSSGTLDTSGTKYGALSYSNAGKLAVTPGSSVTLLANSTAFKTSNFTFLAYNGDVPYSYSGDTTRVFKRTDGSTILTVTCTGISGVGNGYTIKFASDATATEIANLRFTIENKSTVRLDQNGGTNIQVVEDYGVAKWTNSTAQNRIAAYYIKYAVYYDLSMSMAFKASPKTAADAVGHGDTFTFSGSNITMPHFCLERNETYLKPPTNNANTKWSVYSNGSYTDAQIKQKILDVGGINLNNLTYTGSNGGTYGFTAEEFCRTLMSVKSKDETGLNVTRTPEQIQNWIWNLVQNKTNILPTSTSMSTPQKTKKGTMTTFPYTIKVSGATVSSGSTLSIKPNTEYTFTATPIDTGTTGARAFRNQYFTFTVSMTGSTLTKTTSNDVDTYKLGSTVICTVTRTTGSASFKVKFGNINASQISRLKLNLVSDDSKIAFAQAGTVAPTTVKHYGVAIYKNTSYQNRITAFYTETLTYYDAKYNVSFAFNGKSDAMTDNPDVVIYKTNLSDYSDVSSVPNKDIKNFCAQQDEVYPGPSTSDTWSVYTSIGTNDSSMISILKNRLGIDLAANDISPIDFCKQLYSATETALNVDRTATNPNGEEYGYMLIQRYIWWLQGKRNSTPITTVPSYATTVINKGDGNVHFTINGLSNNSLNMIAGQSRTLTVSPYQYQGTNNIMLTTNLTSANYEIVVTNAGGKVTASISGTNQITINVDSTATTAQIDNAVITIRSKSSVKLDQNGATAPVKEYYGFGINVNSAKQNRVTGYYYKTQEVYSMSQEFGLGTQITIQLYKDISRTTNKDDSKIVLGNSCYSFVGTKYTLYSDAACTQAVKTFTYSSNHNFNSTYVTSATPRTLYLKETAVGKGYKLDPIVYSVEIESTTRIVLDGRTITSSDGIFKLDMTNQPGIDPIRISISKTNQNQNMPAAQLTNAVFRLAFYPDNITWSAGTPPTLPDNPAVRLEIPYTTSNLEITRSLLESLSPVGGNNIAYWTGALAELDNQGLDGDRLPYGTYLLYEITPPTGYLRCNSGIIFKNYMTSGVSHQARLTVNVDANGNIIGNSTGGDTYNETGAFAYTVNDSTGTDLNVYVREVPYEGSITLTKELANNSQGLVGDIANKFNFSLYQGTTLIATGTTLSNGQILWTYQAHIRETPHNGTAVGTELDLYGTTTTTLEYLPVYRGDGTVPVQYQLREEFPTFTYGDTGIPYTYGTPEGWTRGTSYFYKNVTLNGATDFKVVQSITNSINFGSIQVNKTKPAGDEFDLSKVHFELDRVYNNDPIRIAEGTVDENGNITWTKVSTTGMGTEHIQSVNNVANLPSGTYIVREWWDKTYIDSLDGEHVQIIEKNNSGWAEIESDSKYIYEKTAVITENSNTSVSLGSVENKTISQKFNAYKTTSNQGDETAIELDLYYIGDNSTYIYMASGTVETGANPGRYDIAWAYNGTIIENNGVQSLVLPAGSYELREITPETEIYGIPYTYKVPDGFTKANGYFYKRFEVEESATESISINIINQRVEASLIINKVEDAQIPSDSFVFDIYYRGQGTEAVNVGNYNIDYLVTSVTIETTNGNGSAELTKLPEGWYEIKEHDKTQWNESWVGSVTTQNTKLVHADSNGQTNAEIVIPAITAENTLKADVRVIKTDAWTQTTIVMPSAEDKVEIALYLDVNEDGQVDNEDTLIAQQETSGNALTFENLGKGKYLLVETKTVNGFYLKSDVITFEVSGFTNADKIVDNKPYTAPVSVTKIDADTNNPLTGAEFKVYVDVNDNSTFDSADTLAKVWVDSNTNGSIEPEEIVDCVMTGNNGVYTSNGELHWNDGATFGNRYLLVETQAPENYFFVDEQNRPSANNTVKAFVIEAKDTTATNFTVAPSELTVKNMTGRVEVVKRTEDGQYLANCTFGIFSDADCTELIGTLDEITSEQLYRYTGLGLGTYYLKELSSPEGYTVDYNTYTFQITTTQPNVVVDNADWSAIEGEAGLFINAPAITKTMAAHVGTNSQSGVNGVLDIVDHVYYKGLTPNEKYTLVLDVYDKATGTYAVYNPEIGNSDRLPGIAFEFTPTETTGIFDIPYNVTGVNTVNRTYVLGVVMTDSNDKVVGRHFDLADTLETLYFGSIKTTLKDTETNSKQVALKETVTLTDTIAYTNLVPGVTYTLVGQLVDKATGDTYSPVTKNFTPTEANGTVEMTFTMSHSDVEGKTLVAFEKLYIGATLVFDHSDINDVDQTVYVPRISTTFIDSHTEDHIGERTTNATFIDTVAFENLIVGETYTATGIIMNKSTNSPLLDANNHEITSTQTFVATATSGTVDLTFTLDTTALENVKLVAFETLTYKSKVVAEHKDINDEGQTITIPGIRTTLKSTDTDEHIAPVAEQITLVDHVSCQNLIIDKEYTIEGVLMDKDTNTPLLTASGDQITATLTFTATEVNCVKDIEFTFSSELLKGKTVVAFETLKYLGKTVAVHTDINDNEQTVHFPEIHTTLISTDTTEHVAPVNEQLTLVDTVSYSNLIVGKSYTLTGTLMDKNTGNALVVNGNPVTASTTFTAETANGTVDVTFTFPASALGNKTLVAFEALQYENTQLVTHNDITDVDQTVYIPNIHTTFADTSLGVPNTAHVGTSVSLVDTVTYSNLIPNKTYTLYGSIWVKETNTQLLDDKGEPIVGTTTFTPTTANGTVTMEFTVDTTNLQGKTLVAFETLDYNGITLVIHADINDHEQTVRVPKIHTTAKNKADNSQVINGAYENQTIVDTVYFENLNVGQTYKAIGTLMIKDTNEPARDASGSIITAEKTFTAEVATGTVDVEFVVDGRLFAGEKLVVFETLYQNNKELTVHADINDENQTIEVELLMTVKIAKADKDNIAYYLKDAEITIFNEDGSIAKDVNGVDCVGMTGEDGSVSFRIKYDKNNHMYAMETKAPAGYQLSTEKFYITLNEAGVPDFGTIKINILDAIIIIPPQTGDTINLSVLYCVMIMSTLFAAILAVTLVKKRKQIQ